MKHIKKSNSACDMRGFLSFLILWLLNKRSMNGTELAEEIGKRRGCKPTPGTIYPALKELVKKGTIKSYSKKSKTKIYTLTELGKTELKYAKEIFCKTFYDMLSS